MSDIAINPVTRRVQFTGNTGTGPFAFTFNVLNSGDIEVYKNTTLLTLTSDYTVSIASNGTGSVTLQAGQAVVSADYLTIIGGRDLERTTDFVTAGDLLASSLNEQLDSNVIMSQQLDESFGRSVSVSPGDVDVSMTLPVASSRASQVLAFTSTGAVTTTNLNDLPELTVDKLNVDNLTLDGNTISTTNTNGNLILTPNGTGDVVVSGDLVVNGTTTTIHSTVVDIADKNITIAYGSADAAAANGAGITVAGADATMNYYSTPDGWEFNKAVTVGYTGVTPQDLGGVLNVYSSSSSVPGMVIKSTASVDPKIQFEYSSQIWTVGQDSSSDDFKIINGTNLNSSAEIHINTDGDVALGGVSHYSNYELSVPQRVAIRSGSAVAGIDFASPTELVFDGNVGGTNGSFSKFRFVSSETDKMVLDGSTLKVNALAKVSGSEITISDNVVISGSITADSYNLPGVLSLADGSNSAPSLTNTGDTNTGLYFPAADEVGITAGGTQRLKVDSTGIDVTGAITSSGNISISRSNTHSEGYALQIDKQVINNIGISTYFLTNAYYNSGYKYISNGAAMRLDVGGGSYIFRTAASNSSGADATVTSWTTRATIDSSGIDVTGTVSADGLTVDGDMNMSDSTPVFTMTDTDGGSANMAVYTGSLVISADSANEYSNKVLQLGVGDKAYFNLADNGDISFREDQGTTPKFFWDAAAESLGIGTDSPDASLTVSDGGSTTAKFSSTASNCRIALSDTNSTYWFHQRIGSEGNDLIFETTGTTRMTIDSSGNVGIGVEPTTSYGRTLQIHNPAATGSNLRLTNSGSGSGVNNGFEIIQIGANNYLVNRESGFMAFSTSSEERMRIDSSGNLLVGTTNANPTGNHEPGTLIAEYGQINVHRDGGNPLRVGSSVDGNLTEYYKQGALVGSIASQSGPIAAYLGSSYATIGAGDTGIFFSPDNDHIVPVTATSSATRDNAIDLGSSSGRFKDLYLSGGVYLGGTGAANKLDDYEEGTFTPTAVGSAGGGSTSYSFQYGYYTKVGRNVSVTIFVSWTAMTDAGNLEIRGLPFTVANDTQHYSVATVMSSLLNWGGGSVLTGLGKINTTTIPVYYVGDNIAAATQAVVNEAANVRISMTYHTA